MWSRVYVMVGCHVAPLKPRQHGALQILYCIVLCPSFRLYVPSFDCNSGVCGGFAAECRADRSCRSTTVGAARPAAMAPQHGTAARRSAANVMLPADLTRLNLSLVHFYRAMLCIRGTSRGPVSVCLCLCLSQVGVLLKRLNVGSHKQPTQ